MRIPTSREKPRVPTDTRVEGEEGDASPRLSRSAVRNATLLPQVRKIVVMHHSPVSRD